MLIHRIYVDTSYFWKCRERTFWCKFDWSSPEIIFIFPIEPLQWYWLRNSKNHYNDTDYVTVKTGSGTVSYSRNQLLSLRKTHHKIKELGISKHRRGRVAELVDTFVNIFKFIPIIELKHLRVRAFFHKTVRVCHVYCNFKIGFTRRINFWNTERWKSYN